MEQIKVPTIHPFFQKIWNEATFIITDSINVNGYFAIKKEMLKHN